MRFSCYQYLCLQCSPWYYTLAAAVNPPPTNHRVNNEEPHRGLRNSGNGKFPTLFLSKYRKPLKLFMVLYHVIFFSVASLSHHLWHLHIPISKPSSWILEARTHWLWRRGHALMSCRAEGGWLVEFPSQLSRSGLPAEQSIHRQPIETAFIALS